VLLVYSPERSATVISNVSAPTANIELSTAEWTQSSNEVIPYTSLTILDETNRKPCYLLPIDFCSLRVRSIPIMSCGDHPRTCQMGEIRQIHHSPLGSERFCVVLLESLTLYNHHHPIHHLNEKVVGSCIVRYFDYPLEESVRNIVHSSHNVLQKPSYVQQLSEIKLPRTKSVILQYLTDVLSIGKTLTSK
jgi:hypothetical protein